MLTIEMAFFRIEKPQKMLLPRAQCAVLESLSPPQHMLRVSC